MMLIEDDGSGHLIEMAATPSLRTRSRSEAS